MLDLFLSVAYDFYYERLDHSCTIRWQPEEQKAREMVAQRERSSRSDMGVKPSQRGATIAGI